MMAQLVNPSLASSDTHTGTGYSPGCYTSDPTSCPWTRKSVEGGCNLWEPAPTSGIWKNLLAPGLGSAQLFLLQSFGA